MNCVAQGDEHACDTQGESLQCNAELAERYLNIFSRFNENIDVEKADKTKFKCFKFRMSGQEDYYMKGCTYQSIPLCDNILGEMACSTCEPANCNMYHYSDYHEDDSDKVAPREASIAVVSICLFLVHVVYLSRMR